MTRMNEKLHTTVLLIIFKLEFQICLIYILENSLNEHSQQLVVVGYFSFFSYEVLNSPLKVTLPIKQFLSCWSN